MKRILPVLAMLIILLVMVLFLAGPVSAATQSVHIDSSAGSGGDGSVSSPYNELSDIDSSLWNQISAWISNGDDVEIRLKYGSVFDEVSWEMGAGGSSSHWIKVTSYGSGDQPKIKDDTWSERELLDTSGYDYIWIDDIEFEKGKYGVCNDQGSHHIKITRCMFDRSGKHGTWMKGGAGHVIGGSPGMGNIYANIGDTDTWNSNECGAKYEEHGTRFIHSYNEHYGDNADFNPNAGVGKDGVMMDHCSTDTDEDWSIIEYNYIHDLGTNEGNDGHGINLKESEWIIVRYNNIQDGIDNGILVTDDARDIYVYGNNVIGNYIGIAVRDGDDDCWIRDQSDCGVKRVHVWGNLVAESHYSPFYALREGDKPVYLEDLYIHNNVFWNNNPPDWSSGTYRSDMCVFYNGDIWECDQSSCTTSPSTGEWKSKDYYGTVYLGDWSSNQISIRNNIFGNNRKGCDERYNLYVTDTDGIASFTDNIFWHDDGTGSTEIYYEGSVSDCSSVGSYNTEENPGFTNANNNDFTLQSGSPARDTGVNLGHIIRTDYHGYDDCLYPDAGAWDDNPPAGVALASQDDYEPWDIGAYVYVGELPSCESLNGDPCSGLQLCEGGSFQASSDYGNLCCVGGVCQDPPQDTCFSLNGDCCSADQICQDGSFVSSSDCDILCCTGTCQDVSYEHMHMYIEAESGTISSPMQTGNDAAASGGQYIFVPAGTGDSSSPADEAVYPIDIRAAGDYYLWLLMYGPTSQNDALYIGFNGNFDRVYPSSPGQYEWVRAETTHRSGDYGHSLLLGQNEIQISHGEELARADSIFLTDDPDLHPTQVSSHNADISPRDGCIDIQELTAFIDLWHYDSTAYTMSEMMEAVTLYYSPGSWCS